ncbi:MAG: sigma-70 family RNA polymerase sigma factor [Spirochaetales bacterium]
MIDREEDEEDVRLVHRVLRGDLGAFGDLVKRHQKGVFYFCLASLKHPDEAEDAAQEVFLRAYRSLGTFRLDKRFKTWLFSIAVNHLKTRWKKQNKGLLDRWREWFSDSSNREEENPETVALEAMEGDRIRQAVQELPEGLRTVVVLYYFEGLAVSEVATALGIGEEGVKSRLFRARKLLRKALEED